MKTILFNKYYRSFNILSLILIIVSLVLLLFKGLNYGIDFRGGTMIMIQTPEKIKVADFRDILKDLEVGDTSVTKISDPATKLTSGLVTSEKNLVMVRIEQDNNEEAVQNRKIISVKKALKAEISDIVFLQTESVGGKVSAELVRTGVWAVILAVCAVLFYIWIRFEWQFSLGAILALFHDVIVTLGLFSLLNLEINLSIIAAVLTIVGYSMNDTVVIFDRVRENLRKYSDIKIYELTNISINETLSRTLITSITTLLALLSIFFFGGEVLKGFSLAMIFGVIFGTYSSIYIANTILVRLNVSQKTVLREADKN